ncbi:MAG: hypothetical protein D6796_12190 [Caldilineae bacterium]|nr:MAG: hypothetical protein D6796_12190 [Caldilineae bacterium]
MDLPALQAELRKRTREPFTPWGQKQSNRWDALTNFIYHTPTWDELKIEVARRRPAGVDADRFFNYAANRWFNFWSAWGVERIFCELDGVQAATNPRDRLVDFTLHGIRFDHKTSVFPRRFPHSLSDAQQHPGLLIGWLYHNQSREGRMHFGNRLFIVLYHSKTGEHWKLRAELLWLKGKIEAYVRHFRPERLVSLQLGDGRVALSDIIWGVW